MVSQRKRLAVALVCACGLPALTGCGPLRSTAFILDAEVQIEAARTARAEQDAPYEFALAQLYIRKAREVVGYSDYEAGVGYAEKASAAARKAKEESMAAATKNEVSPSFTTTPADGTPPRQ